MSEASHIFDPHNFDASLNADQMRYIVVTDIGVIGFKDRDSMTEYVEMQFKHVLSIFKIEERIPRPCENIVYEWFDRAMSKDPYDLCPCGCGKTFRFVIKGGEAELEKHFHQFAEKYRRDHPKLEG
jgi:hypothetical protein